MSARVIMVLSGKSLNTMIEEGGSGHWKAKKESILDCSYIVMVKHRHSKWSEGTEAHGAAFLIGRVVGVKPSPATTFPGKYVIRIGQYATLNKANSWPAGMRNPVSYTDLETLNIDLTDLEWQEFPTVVSPSRSIAASASRI